MEVLVMLQSDVIIRRLGVVVVVVVVAFLLVYISNYARQERGTLKVCI